MIDSTHIKAPRSASGARPRRQRLPSDTGEQSTSDLAELAQPLVRSPFCEPKMGLYVAAVLDLFSRRIVGWSMSATMKAQLVTDALIMGFN